MIKNNERIKQLAKSDLGEALVEWLDDQIKQMVDVTQMKNWEEVLGKQEAVKILRELFNFLVRVREDRTDTKRTDYK